MYSNTHFKVPNMNMCLFHRIICTVHFWLRFLIDIKLMFQICPNSLLQILSNPRASTSFVFAHFCQILSTFRRYLLLCHIVSTCRTYQIFCTFIWFCINVVTKTVCLYPLLFAASVVRSLYYCVSYFLS